MTGVNQPQILKDDLRGRKSYDRITNAEFNDVIYAKKNTPAGFNPDIIFGDNSSSIQLIGRRKSIRAINTTGNIQYISFGDINMTTPTITTGVALLPNSVEFLNSGLEEYVITSDDGVQLTILKDII